ncbi:F-box protein At-B [Abeliophyllum distichum]|uniref:F-box protein At-B n=1 Tax=Abeliophyllum distichum TaxID=126358 RepID=A0ABD1QJ31_9LAMI
MNNINKKPCVDTAAVVAEGGVPPLEGLPLPDTIIFSEIFSKLDLESLCSLACVSRALRSIVSQALSTLPSLDLSAVSLNGEILDRIIPKFRGLKSVTIDCLRLDDSSVIDILGPHLQELNLLKCASLSYNILSSIGKRCPNLRILVLELEGETSPEIFKKNLIEMLKGILCLESLSIKVRGTDLDAYDLTCIDLFLPQTLKLLKLQPVNEQDAILFVKVLGDGKNNPGQFVNFSIPSDLGCTCFTLIRLSLVLNVISDELIISIANSLPLLVELNLEDRPSTEPKLPRDLTNTGLQSLGLSQHLTSLSIVRSRLNYPVSFKRVNDLGVMLLSESCRGLESVKLGGFSTVTDAGFSSILRSCYNLKKFEVRNAPFMSDLAFHDIIGVISPLTELRILSCNLITSEAVAELAASTMLEVLDTYGCRSIADHCLDYISCLSTLTTLNLGGADITDRGLAVLGNGGLPIVRLCLRGCVRVTDRGIFSLLNGGEKIKKMLSSLDIGHMPGISDRGIQTIVSSAQAITELCMRYCFHVTDAALKMLASKRSDRINLLQRLDLYHCTGFSIGLSVLLQNSSFRGLRWLGVGSTSLVTGRDDCTVICEMRPWLTVCFEGCEVGCHDGWQFHKSNGS